MGTNRMNFDRNGEIYPTLVELLRAHSAHFDTTIDSATAAPPPESPLDDDGISYYSFAIYYYYYYYYFRCTIPHSFSVFG